MMKISSDKTIQLRDGRMLGFIQSGGSTGKILFYFHGHPGSRFEVRFLADAIVTPKQAKGKHNYLVLAKHRCDEVGLEII